MNKVIGKPLNQQLRQPEDEFEETAFGQRCVRTYYDATQGWLSRAPAINSEHPDFPACKLRRRRAKQHRSGVATLVTLYYEQLDMTEGASSAVGLPPDEYSDNGSTIDADIRQNPYYKDVSEADRSTIEEAVRSPRPGESPALMDPAAIDLYERLMRGQTTYYDGTFQVTKTSYHYRKPDPQLATYGKKEDPGGGYGFAGHWVLLTGGTRKVGALWARDKVYQFSAEEVPDEIYGTPSPPSP